MRFRLLMSVLLGLAFSGATALAGTTGAASPARAPAFFEDFGGSWTCTFQGAATAWRIDASPGASWSIVRWGDQHSARGGVAYVGFIGPQHAWLYDDFHYDGSYSRNTSPGPVNGAWTWSGTYYLADGTTALHGAVVWKLAAPGRIDRTFERLDGGKLVPTGRDRCVKAT